MPEPVKKYIIHLYALLNASSPSLGEIQAAYEQASPLRTGAQPKYPDKPLTQGWNRLTDKFFAKTEWPEAEVIAPLVNHGQHKKPPFRRMTELTLSAS